MKVPFEYVVSNVVRPDGDEASRVQRRAERWWLHERPTAQNMRQITFTHLIKRYIGYPARGQVPHRMFTYSGLAVK